MTTTHLPAQVKREHARRPRRGFAPLMYRLYYSPGSASLAPHWMLLELGAPHELVRVDIGAGDHRSTAYLSVNPLGLVPAMEVEGQIVTESAALLMLLAERHPEGGLAPTTQDLARAKWLETMLDLSTTLLPAMREWLFPGALPASDLAVSRRLVEARVARIWTRLAMRLREQQYLAGDRVTTADLLGVMAMRWARRMPRPATDWPELDDYAGRLRARPAFAELCRREGLTEWGPTSSG